MENIHGAIESKKAVLNDILVRTAFEFIPPFVVSEDFSSYFEAHQSSIKSKSLHVESKVIDKLNKMLFILMLVIYYQTLFRKLL